MISAIVCTYNREKYILDCLTHILNALSANGVEVIVVDNNSTDGTAELVTNFLADHPDFPARYVLETKQGLSNARNRGISEAKGDVLLFLDDDALVAKDYFKNLNDQLTAHPDANAFGGRIIPVFEDGDTPTWLCRWSLSWVSGLDLGSAVKPFEGKLFPIGANMGLRRSTVERCGMFNPELGRSGGNLIGGEEKDMFRRVRAAGLKTLWFPDVTVEHVIPPSRTTSDYVRRFADGVGSSERMRTKADGTYARRLLSEAVKWCATLALYVWYLLTLRPACGAMLVLFRAHVTRHLLRTAR